jgi:hypothetical protein
MIAESPSIVNKSSTSICGGLRSQTKTALVWLLGWVLAWYPSIAMRLGKLVTRIWPNFRRA